MLRFNGMEVIVHKPLVIKRRWSERLFSWPWRPWRNTRTVTPDDSLWWVGGGQIHVSERGYDALLNGGIKG